MDGNEDSEGEDLPNFEDDLNSDDYPQQDSEGMIMGIGMGNSNITQNFAKISSNHAKGANLLPGLNGDSGDQEDNMDDGDENLAMDDNN